MIDEKGHAALTGVPLERSREFTKPVRLFNKTKLNTGHGPAVSAITRTAFNFNNM